MLIKQKFCCSICSTHVSELSRGLFCDHDHESGHFRGIICQLCNCKLGKTGTGKFTSTDPLYVNVLQYLLYSEINVNNINIRKPSNN